MSSYTFIEGNTPLLISMPHTGTDVPTDIAETMTPEALTLKDTDWFVDQLYDFASSLGVNVIKPTYSRYVIDLNRGVDEVNLYPGANSTELCPTTTFNLSPIYLKSKLLTKVEKEYRIEHYWQPYHQKIDEVLSQLKTKYGFAILLDAHSILSRVPRFFCGQLPDFNFGTADGKSCSVAVSDCIKGLDLSPYSMVYNARFKGGYITRTYGRPENNIHSIQLELSQRTYMNEDEFTFNHLLADEVKPYLSSVVKALLQLDEFKLRT